MSSSRDPGAHPKYDGVYSRVQDKELLEISDLKCCMSMHQPYASLLVAGIKRHEGRSWYTAHRGRLWIAATSKPVDNDEVKRVEDFYRRLYDDPQLHFPDQYPSGCLLGCVLVQVKLFSLLSSDFRRYSTFWINLVLSINMKIYRNSFIAFFNYVFRTACRRKTIVSCIHAESLKVHLSLFATSHKSCQYDFPFEANIKFVSWVLL